MRNAVEGVIERRSCGVKRGVDCLLNYDRKYMFIYGERDTRENEQVLLRARCDEPAR